MFKGLYKSFILLLLFFLLCSPAYSQTYNSDQINEFECSPDEMEKVLQRDGRDRFKQTRYTDFVKPYQQTIVQEVANEITEETGRPTSATDIRADDLKDRGKDFSCMNVDFSKIGENIMEGVDKVGELLTGGIQKAGDIIDDVMEDLSKGLCSNVVNGVVGFVGENLEEIGERGKRKMEAEIREKEIARIFEGGGRDYLINEQIEETFGDKINMLKWRDNKVDKDVFKRSVKSQWSKELEDLYNDFDDQVDEKIDN